jgi:N-acetylmuramoyl-L-alanine amidase
MPCVGLIVLAGSLTVIVAPDDERAAEPAPVSIVEILPTVVIDPGHGGRDDGARNGALVEKHLTLDVSLRLEKVLQEIGFPTLLTRRDDRYLRLAERTAISNQVANALFVSVHFNHARGTESTGIETFFASEKLEEEAPWAWTGFFNPPRPTQRDNGEVLAGCIQTALVRHTQGENRGIRGRPYYVARHTRAPAALVECGFINNPIEARLIANAGYRDLLARSIAEGLASFHKSRPRPAPGADPEVTVGAQ